MNGSIKPMVNARSVGSANIGKYLFDRLIHNLILSIYNIS